MAAKGHDIDEGLVPVTFLIQRLQPVKICRIIELGIQGGLYSADHRYQMWHKGDPDSFATCVTEALANFRQMPVAGGPVRLEAFADLTMQHANIPLTPSPA